MVKGEFEKKALWLFIAIMFGNAANYLFQIIISHYLDVEAYGVTNALFAFYTVITIPSVVFVSVVAKYIAKSNVKNPDAQKDYFAFFLKCSIYISCIVIIVLLFAIPIIRKYLKLTNYGYILVIILAAGYSYLFPVFYGTLQGLKDFKRLGWLFFTPSFLKLNIGFLLVLIGFGVYGVISALLLAVIIACLIGAWFVRKHLPLKISYLPIIDKYSIGRYVSSSIVVSLAMGLLMNSDILWVKYYFSSYDTGIYSVASIIGKLVQYIPATIVAITFPTAVENIAMKKDALKLFIKSIVYSSGLMLLAILVLNLYPTFFITILFGAKYTEAVGYMFPISIMVGVLSTLTTVMMFNLAGNKMKLLTISMSIGVCIYGLLVLNFHNSISQIIFITTITGLSLVIFNSIHFIYNITKNRA